MCMLGTVESVWWAGPRRLGAGAAAGMRVGNRVGIRVGNRVGNRAAAVGKSGKVWYSRRYRRRSKRRQDGYA
ncbi:hypothetical protein F220043C3_18910 [Enterocloster asparagiformis]